MKECEAVRVMPGSLMGHTMAMIAMSDHKNGLFWWTKTTMTPQGNHWDDWKGSKSDPILNWEVYEGVWGSLSHVWITCGSHNGHDSHVWPQKWPFLVDQDYYDAPRQSLGSLKTYQNWPKPKLGRIWRSVRQSESSLDHLWVTQWPW